MRTLLDAIEHWATVKPDDLAFTDYDSGESYSWGRFSQLVESQAQTIYESQLSDTTAGLSQMTTALIIVRQGVLVPSLLAACWKLGIFPVMIHEEYTEHEFNLLLKTVGNGNLLTLLDDGLPPNVASKFRRLSSRSLSFTSRISGRFSDREKPEVKRKLEKPSAQSLALGLFTSGTSAQPKLVVFTSENLFAAASIEIQNESIYGTLPIANLRPHFTSGGLNTLWPSLLIGSAQIFSEEIRKKPIARYLREMLARHSVGCLVVSPAYVRALLDSSDDTPVSARTLPLYFGGSSISSACIKMLCENGFKPSMRYGMTEIGHIVSKVPVSSNQAIAPSSVGKAFANFETRFQDGKLFIKSPGAADFEMVEGSMRPLKDRGWLATQDKCSLSQNGELELEGREHEQIAVSGFRFHPKQVENVLVDSGLVVDARVVGMPETRFGQEAVAICVAPDSSRTEALEAKLRLVCEDKLSPFKRPRRFVWLTAIPTLGNGKVDVVALKAAAKIKD